MPVRQLAHAGRDGDGPGVDAPAVSRPGRQRRACRGRTTCQACPGSVRAPETSMAQAGDSCRSSSRESRNRSSYRRLRCRSRVPARNSARLVPGAQVRWPRVRARGSQSAARPGRGRHSMTGVDVIRSSADGKRHRPAGDAGIMAAGGGVAVSGRSRYLGQAISSERHWKARPQPASLAWQPSAHCRPCRRWAGSGCRQPRPLGRMRRRRSLLECGYTARARLAVTGRPGSGGGLR